MQNKNNTNQNTSKIPQNSGSSENKNSTPNKSFPENKNLNQSPVNDMTFLARIRPWHTIKCYERIVDSMNSISAMKDKTIAAQKETIEQITVKHVEQMTFRTEQIKLATDLLKMQNEKVATLSARPEVTGFTNLPTAEELEREVNNFFARQPLSVCQQALEIPTSEVTPTEARTVQRVMTRLWRQGALNQIERAAKSDAL